MLKIIKTNNINIEYDTDWIKNYCVVCNRSLRIDEARYEISGNFCPNCSSKATSKVELRGQLKNDPDNKVILKEIDCPDCKCQCKIDYNQNGGFGLRDVTNCIRHSPSKAPCSTCNDKQKI